MTSETLRSRLAYAPIELAFGTSGLRGPVIDLTNLEAWINTTGFLRFLQAEADLSPGETIYTGSDLRASSETRVEGRGQILQAVHQAIRDAGYEPRHLGRLPTPALTYFALRQQCASVMVTGSHIPFDRNGIKFNRREGEVLKADEPGIMGCVAQVRQAVYDQPWSSSPFDEQGMWRQSVPLIGEDERGRRAYVQRYLDAFPGHPLRGRRLLLYQHSAVGRDLVLEILESLGADVVPAGRSDTFVPIDTEDVREDQLAVLRDLLRTAPGSFDAIVSTDGDSDRPLLVSVAGDHQIRFHGGDLLGIVVSEWLEADAVVVPVSANDAVERALGPRVQPRTRIGSPYVIDGMRRATGRRVVGFEANGGFLLGSDVEWPGRILHALPTRDAVLPIVAALSAAAAPGEPYSLARAFDALPRRFSKAGLIDNFPLAASRRIVSLVSLPTPQVTLSNAAQPYGELRAKLETVFSPQEGFGRVAWLNTIDGLRIGFDNGDVAHVRPSGNAPQLRIYANADSQARADAIVARGIEEPGGLLRQLEAMVG
jgi:phosphomannomutase